MYISAYCDRCVDLDDVGFFNQQLACFVANLADLRFRDNLAGSELRNSPVFIYQCVYLRNDRSSSRYLSRSLIFTPVARSRAGMRGTCSRQVIESVRNACWEGLPTASPFV